MTTIILVSIGVLIAAVAALFMIFYGGDAYSQSQAKSEAARLVGEGVQIQAAVQAFRAQEDRMPGDGVNVDPKAMKDLLCNKYLNHVPRGVADDPPPSYTPTECRSPTVKGSSPWKIDYNYGIARSIVGAAYESDGTTKSKAWNVCVAARKQMGYDNEADGGPKRCSEITTDTKEPCCIMSADDAAA